MTRNKLVRGKTFKHLPRRHTAYHEAGHAVMAWAHGMNSVNVHVNKTSVGWVGFTSYSAPKRMDPLVIAVISLAGHEAEVRWCRRKITRLPWGDYRDCERIGFASHSIAEIGRICRRRVWTFRKYVKKVADALMLEEDVDVMKLLKALC